MPTRRTMFAVPLTISLMSAVQAQAPEQPRATLPNLFQKAVTACEAALSGGTLAGQKLDGFAPITVASTLEAFGRGISTGPSQAWVKVMRNQTTCVVMVRDNIRHEAAPSVEAWSRAAKVDLVSQPDGARSGRGDRFHYHHHVAKDDINVLAVNPLP